MDHTPFIHRTLTLAARGRGFVGNGAMVGAVLVRNGHIIAEGWHKGFGLPHAERDLLEAFPGQIEALDILYVNLEPCCHQGKTPPCTQILIDRGVKTVVFGMVDPDPRVSGSGRALLEEKNVKVIGPVLRAQCEWFNRGFMSVRTKGRPWVILKKAQTADGQIANTDGSKMKITSNQQDLWSHTYFRALTDAIIVGSGTIISDDPSLNIRKNELKKFNTESALNDEENSDHYTCPIRIILDPSFRMPDTAKVVTDECRSKTMILTSDVNAESEKATSLRTSGVRVCSVQLLHDGTFDWEDLWSVLCGPSKDSIGITSVLVEGGRKTWNAFEQADSYDEKITLLKST